MLIFMKGWLIALAILSFIICLWDIKFRKVPNWLCIVTAISCVIIMLVNGHWLNIFHAFAILVLGIFLSHLRLLGGGDSKLFAAYSLAISANHLPLTMFAIALAGGLVSLVCLIWVKLLNKPNRGVPYAIAIAIGCYLGILVSLPA